MDLWGRKRRKFLDGLRLGEPHEEILGQCLELVGLLDGQVSHSDAKLKEIVQLTEEAKRLITVPGIQKVLAITILSETGPIDRFPSAKHYVSYRGLAPKTHASAG